MQLENVSYRTKWARCTAGLGAVCILFLVSVGAPVHLGSNLVWPGDPDNASAATDCPLTFDAPIWAVAQEKLDEKAAQPRTNVVPPDGDVVLLDDWDYSAIVRGRFLGRHKPPKHKPPKHKPSKHK